MKLELQVKMNPSLFLRDPEQSELGKNIIKHSIHLIHDNGFEAFTFKKLAESIGTTEAGVYRYFENKHKLLVYIFLARPANRVRKKPHQVSVALYSHYMSFQKRRCLFNSVHDALN